MSVLITLSLTKEISCIDSRFLLVKDTLEMMAQVGRLEQHSTKIGQSQFVTATRVNCEWCEEKSLLVKF